MQRRNAGRRARRALRFTSKNKQWEKRGGHALGTAADAQAAAERRRMALTPHPTRP